MALCKNSVRRRLRLGKKGRKGAGGLCDRMRAFAYHGGKAIVAACVFKLCCCKTASLLKVSPKRNEPAAAKKWQNALYPGKGS
jgi:hypothetical protein